MRVNDAVASQRPMTSSSSQRQNKYNINMHDVSHNNNMPMTSALKKFTQDIPNVKGGNADKIVKKLMVQVIKAGLRVAKSNLPSAVRTILETTSSTVNRVTASAIMTGVGAVLPPIATVFGINPEHVAMSYIFGPYGTMIGIGLVTLGTGYAFDYVWNCVIDHAADVVLDQMPGYSTLYPKEKSRQWALKTLIYGEDIPNKAFDVTDANTQTWFNTMIYGVDVSNKKTTAPRWWFETWIFGQTPEPTPGLTHLPSPRPEVINFVEQMKLFVEKTSDYSADTIESYIKSYNIDGGLKKQSILSNQDIDNESKQIVSDMSDEAFKEMVLSIQKIICRATEINANKQVILDSITNPSVLGSVLDSAAPTIFTNPGELSLTFDSQEVMKPIKSRVRPSSHERLQRSKWLFKSVFDIDPFNSPTDLFSSYDHHMNTGTYPLVTNPDVQSNIDLSSEALFNTDMFPDFSALINAESIPRVMDPEVYPNIDISSVGQVNTDLFQGQIINWKNIPHNEIQPNANLPDSFNPTEIQQHAKLVSVQPNTDRPSNTPGPRSHVVPEMPEIRDTTSSSSLGMGIGSTVGVSVALAAAKHFASKIIPKPQKFHVQHDLTFMWIHINYLRDYTNWPKLSSKNYYHAVSTTLNDPLNYTNYVSSELFPKVQSVLRQQNPQTDVVLEPIQTISLGNLFANPTKPEKGVIFMLTNHGDPNQLVQHPLYFTKNMVIYAQLYKFLHYAVRSISSNKDVSNDYITMKELDVKAFDMSSRNTVYKNTKVLARFNINTRGQNNDITNLCFMDHKPNDKFGFWDLEYSSSSSAYTSLPTLITNLFKNLNTKYVLQIRNHTQEIDAYVINFQNSNTKMIIVDVTIEDKDGTLNDTSPNLIPISILRSVNIYFKPFHSEYDDIFYNYPSFEDVDDKLTHLGYHLLYAELKSFKKLDRLVYKINTEQLFRDMENRYKISFKSEVPIVNLPITGTIDYNVKSITPDILDTLKKLHYMQLLLNKFSRLDKKDLLLRNDTKAFFKFMANQPELSKFSDRLLKHILEKQKDCELYAKTFFYLLSSCFFNRGMIKLATGGFIINDKTVIVPYQMSVEDFVDIKYKHFKSNESFESLNILSQYYANQYDDLYQKIRNLDTYHNDYYINKTTSLIQVLFPRITTYPFVH